MYEDIMEKLSERRRVFDGAIIHVDHMTATLPNGRQALREVAVHIGAAAVIPVDKDRNVYLVRQFRAPLDKVTLEIPAGKLDYKGEDRFECAKRELREETGAVCESLEFIGRFHPSPAILDECISMYLARGLGFGQTDPDDDEFIQIEKVPMDKLCEMICRGEITDGKTQAGVLKAKYIIEHSGGVK